MVPNSPYILELPHDLQNALKNWKWNINYIPEDLTSKRNLSNRLDSRPASKICFDVRQEMFLSHRQTKLVKIFRVGQVWVLALSAGMPGSLELDKGAERAKLVDIYLILPGTASRGKCRVQVCSVPNLVPGDEEMKMLPSRNLKSCQKLLEDCCNIINW